MCVMLKTILFNCFKITFSHGNFEIGPALKVLVLIAEKLKEQLLS